MELKFVGRNLVLTLAVGLNRTFMELKLVGCRDAILPLVS